MPSIKQIPTAWTRGGFNWEYTSWIADSNGDRERKGDLAGMWPGTRSKRTGLPAIRLGRTLLLTCCDNQRHILLQLRLAR